MFTAFKLLFNVYVNKWSAVTSICIYQLMRDLAGMKVWIKKQNQQLYVGCKIKDVTDISYPVAMVSLWWGFLPTVQKVVGLISIKSLIPGWVA